MQNDALKQPSAEATALALTATPEDFPTDSYSLALWLDRARPTAAPAEREEVRESVARIITEKMREWWDEICSDTGCHPLDIVQEGRRKLSYHDGHWTSAVAQSSASAILAKLQPSDRADQREGDGARIVEYLRDKAKSFRKAAFDQKKRAGPLANAFELAADEIAMAFPPAADQREAVSEGGWVRVPVEPTTEMLDAGVNSDLWGDNTIITRVVREVWSAMLAAASAEDKS